MFGWTVKKALKNAQKRLACVPSSLFLAHNFTPVSEALAILKSLYAN
jgi:hypothetical protein